MCIMLSQCMHRMISHSEYMMLSQCMHSEYMMLSQCMHSEYMMLSIWETWPGKSLLIWTKCKQKWVDSSKLMSFDVKGLSCLFYFLSCILLLWKLHVWKGVYVSKSFLSIFPISLPPPFSADKRTSIRKRGPQARGQEYSGCHGNDKRGTLLAPVSYWRTKPHPPLWDGVLLPCQRATRAGCPGVYEDPAGRQTDPPTCRGFPCCC